MASPDGPASILRLAHRGDWRMAPENSLAALVAGALAPRSDGVEFDVRHALDGTPVVIHDATLERVQGVDARVASMAASALDTYGVPTLAGVFEALPTSAFLDVELKDVASAAVAGLLEAARGPAPVDAVVSSFREDALATMADFLPGWIRWLNTERLDRHVIDRAREIGCRGIAAEWRTISPALARRATDAGLDLAAFTTRREATVLRLARLGVRAVCVEGRPLD